MTDYEKLKAFAEELFPEFEFEKFYKHQGDCVVDSLYRDGKSISITGKNNTSRYSDNEDWNNFKNLDQWINETREYWREQGLPSLQKPKGKLYEMPNTVVHLKTQEEYDEYMQMCEDVGWNNDYNSYSINRTIRVNPSLKQTTNPDWYRGQGCTVLSLQELKKRIGVEKRGGYVLDYITTLSKDFIDSWNREPYYKQIMGMDFGKEINKTNKKSIMKNIKDTLKALTHSKEDKALIKAGLKDSELNWTYEADEYADLLNRQERQAQDDFTEKMLKVAEARNEDCK